MPRASVSADVDLRSARIHQQRMHARHRTDCRAHYGSVHRMFPLHLDDGHRRRAGWYIGWQLSRGLRRRSLRIASHARADLHCRQRRDPRHSGGDAFNRARDLRALISAEDRLLRRRDLFSAKLRARHGVPSGREAGARKPRTQRAHGRNDLRGVNGWFYRRDLHYRLLSHRLAGHSPDHLARGGHSAADRSADWSVRSIQKKKGR